jgi:hypothetical protein
MTSLAEQLTIITCSKSDFMGLSKTLASITSFQQDFPSLKLVLSNYTDEQIEVILEQIEYTSSSVLNIPPKGIYSAMNAGLFGIDTTFVMFLNGGDILLAPEELRKLISKCADGSWGYGSLAILPIQPNLSRIYKFKPYSSLLHRFGIKYVPHPSTVISTELIQRIGGFDEKYMIAADQKLIMQCALVSEPKIIGEVISGFYLGGASYRTSKEINNDFANISKELFGLIGKSYFIDKTIWSLLYLLRRLIKG